MWNIQWLQQALGMKTCRLLLFAHAISVCDTISRLFGIGKTVALKKNLLDDNFFQQQAAVFYNSKASVDEVISASENAIVSFHNGSATDSLISFAANVSVKMCQ